MYIYTLTELQTNKKDVQDPDGIIYEVETDDII